MLRKFLKNSLLGIALLGLGALISAFLGAPAQAGVTKESADFEVQRIPSSGQVDTSANYFDLRFKPKSTQTIRMRVQNFSDHKITVHSTLRNAMTQMGGGISFTENTEALDPSLKYPFTKLAKLKKGHQKIKLAPQQAKIIEATIKMPAKHFEGMIYGDWHFIEYAKKNKGKSATISGNYAYSMGIALRGRAYNIYPKLKYRDVTPTLYHRHPAIAVNLRNIKPMALTKVSAQAVITPQGKDKPKYVFQKADTSVAPNSVISLPISWAYNRLKPGKYTVKAKLSGQNLWNRLPMQWTFKKSFTVSKDTADKLNKQAIKKPVNKWAFAAVASGVLMIVSAVALWRVIRLRP